LPDFIYVIHTLDTTERSSFFESEIFEKSDFVVAFNQKCAGGMAKK